MSDRPRDARGRYVSGSPQDEEKERKEQLGAFLGQILSQPPSYKEGSYSLFKEGNDEGKKA